MKLVRYTHPQLPSTSDFDQLFNELWSSFPRWAVSPESRRGTHPAVDLYEDDNNVYARFELPGFKKDEIKIQIEKDVLTVEVNRTSEDTDAQNSVNLSRAVSIPEGVDVDNVSARLEDGILSVTLPKQEARKPRMIEIK